MHVDELHPRWQRAANAVGGGMQRLAQRNDVAALGHGDAQRNHFLPLVTHLHGGRVHIAALDLGDIAQAQLCARRATDRHGAQVFNGVELTLHPHLHLVLRGLNSSGALHGVLLAQLGQHLVHVQAQLRQALLRDFDEQLFVLHAKQLNLGDIGHTQQLLACVVGKLLEFGVAEALGLQRVDHAIHIAKVVVEERALDALRQGVAHVAHLLAHAVPDVGHLARLGRILDLKDDLRLAGLRITADLVRVGHLLQRALDLVSDLLGHLLRRGARPVGTHHHGTEGERRVLVLPQLEIGGKPQQHQHHHQVAREGGMVERPLGEVEPLFGLYLRHGRPQLAVEAAGAAAVAAGAAGIATGLVAVCALLAGAEAVFG
ncbi:hypothetical protein D3C71_837210 [compost metagenome]